MVVLSGDVPLVSAEAIGELIEVHTGQSGAAATMASTILDDPTGYGRVVRDSAGAVERVVETKEHGDSTQAEREIREVNTGIFVFAARALRHALPRLSADNAQGELYLPQVLDLLRADGAAVAAHVVEDERLVLGVNDRVALARVRRLAQDGDPRAAHARGRGHRRPRRDGDRRGRGDRAGHGDRAVHARSGAARGSGGSARCATPTSSTACSRTASASDRSATCAREPCCARAPGWARSWRSRTPTSAPARRVPHLSYIGDADVGEGTNLGAATITANYDGRAKHRTTVGRGVRTGVDTTLVAPVSVGDDAYTGAGSVITEDVPPGALGIARERQSNVEGYAERGGGGRARR